MNLAIALSEKKAAQNALARLISMRDKNLFFDRKKKPELDFLEIEKQIEEKLKRIDDLKFKILYTNCHTKLDNGIFLQDAIIKLGNIRSELNCYNQLLEKDPEDRLVFFRGSSEVQEYIAQVDKLYLMKRIEELEKQKYDIDTLIGKTNNMVELITEIPE